jgi:hypothetical protein
MPTPSKFQSNGMLKNGQNLAVVSVKSCCDLDQRYGVQVAKYGSGGRASNLG